MKFQTVNNEELVLILKSKAQTERNITLEIIELLEELDTRKLHLKMGFGSLLEFCVKELKYSESAAYSRISVMRVVREVPQAKACLTSGTLNPATLSQAQTFLNQEKKYNNKSYSKNEKLDLLVSLENKSKRQCEKLLIEKSVIERATNTNNFSKSKIKESANQESLNIKNPTVHRRNTPKPPGAFASRYIPSIIKQKVFIRDKGCCTFKDHKTNQKCNSRHLIQYDHVTPFSYGGATTLENLRLLCFNHHKLITQITFSHKTNKFQ